jgi:hypothetical protein
MLAMSGERVPCSPDHYEADRSVIPAGQSRALTQHVRKTTHGERFHTTLRQRVSRLGRHPLAFATNVEHSIGALRSFLWHSALTRAA